MRLQATPDDAMNVLTRERIHHSSVFLQRTLWFTEGGWKGGSTSDNSNHFLEKNKDGTKCQVYSYFSRKGRKTNLFFSVIYMGVLVEGQWKS